MTWIVYALLAAFFAALVAIFGKIGLTGVDSTLATSVRALVMAGFLVLVSLALGKWSAVGQLNSRALVFITLSGVAGALSWLAYFFALQHGPASRVAALDRLSVVFVLILAALFLAESAKWTAWLGAGLLTAGAILMVF